MWALPTTHLSLFFFYLSLFLSVFCSSTSTFFPCRHLLFFPSRSRVHACTPTPVACLHSEACVRPRRKAPRRLFQPLSALVGVFFFLFFPSLALRGDQNERLRIGGILRTWIQSLQLSRNSGGGFEWRRSRRNRWHQTLRLKAQ